jgi:hypothetical protein
MVGEWRGKRNVFTTLCNVNSAWAEAVELAFRLGDPEILAGKQESREELSFHAVRKMQLFLWLGWGKQSFLTQFCFLPYPIPTRPILPS